MAREISAERRGGETILVVEIDLRIVSPSVAGGSGHGDLRAGYQNIFPVDCSFRPNKAAIFSGNTEAAQPITLADQSAANMMK